MENAMPKEIGPAPPGRRSAGSPGRLDRLSPVWIGELVEQYADFPLGGTDASVVALAERLRTEVIITLDRRHFGIVRPKHCERFILLP